MGSIISLIFPGYFQKEQIWICMVGLKNAGKTNILFKLVKKSKGEVVHTIPSDGFYVDTLYYKNIVIPVFNTGGVTNLRPLWKHYYTNVNAIIFVIDSADIERLPEARDEIEIMLNDESRGVPILVLANKQDLPSAMTREQIAENLGFNKLGGREWFVQPICSSQIEGIVDGLDWLSKKIKKT